MLFPSVPRWTRYEKTNTPCISDPFHPRETPIRCVCDPIRRGEVHDDLFSHIFQPCDTPNSGEC